MTSAAKKIFIGVAWPYVNGDIHIGHLAGYLLPADVYARFNRYAGNEVLMVSGSDCFGTPITVEADKRKISASALVDEYHPKAVELFNLLNLSFDNYTKTDTPHHRKIVQDFFITLTNKGLIFKDKTKQYYSDEEKRFLPDRYVEGVCPFCKVEKSRSDQCDACGSPIAEGELINPVSKNTGTQVVLKETEHYFLDWPKLQSFLDSYVGSHSKEWRSWIKAETNKWLKAGLQPRAITRDLDWGVEIPQDRLPPAMRIENGEHKRIYVWFDAVIGYYSASIEWANKTPGKSWESFWHSSDSHHAYFMGKDNLVFHTLFWPGQLHAFDEKLHLPDLPAINQFLTLGGQKFSKSRGITVDSKKIVEDYGLDPVRFYIASIAPETSDSSFTWEEFITKTNSVLIGNIGNFINRSLKLSETVNFELTYKIDESVTNETAAFIKRAYDGMTRASLREYSEAIILLSTFANKYISDKAPWKIKDRTLPEFGEIMANCMYMILALGAMFVPIIPGSADKLFTMLGVRIDKWPYDTSTELMRYLTNVKITNPAALFAKIETKAVDAK